jgi:cell division protein FtsX
MPAQLIERLIAMLNYYFRLALVSIRRNWMLTLLMISAIALGVSMTMASYAVLHVMSRDPIPGKSNQLFAVQLDAALFATTFALAVAAALATGRKTQIGVRRALGATRLAIVRYFLIENGLLCSSGVLLGVIASITLNTWLWVHFGIDRITAAQLLICAIVVVSLGQFSAMIPAMRAARTSPAEALRSN